MSVLPSSLPPVGITVSGGGGKASAASAAGKWIAKNAWRGLSPGALVGYAAQELTFAAAKDVWRTLSDMSPSTPIPPPYNPTGPGAPGAPF